MNRIRELRLLNGWRQEDLADRMHMKKNTISRYETGSLGIDAETICQLCEIFGCTADYLLCRSSVPTVKLSPEDEQLLTSWHSAPPDIRAIVDTALAPYKGNAGSKAG